LVSLLAPTLLTRLPGFPQTEATTSAIVFARLFGVRDIGLGAVILYGIWHPELQLPIILLNGLTDAGDLLSFLLGIRVKPELSRPLGLCAGVAGGTMLLWGGLFAASQP
jgi:hypothetical protein